VHSSIVTVIPNKLRGGTGSLQPTQDRKQFASRKEAAKFVMEDLEESRHSTVELEVDGVTFGIAEIEQIYMAGKST
jgi:hypothetical protein